MRHCLLHQVTQAAVAELILWPQEQQFLVRSRHSTQPARSCPQLENRCYPWQILLLWNPSEIYSRKWSGSKQEQEHWKDKSVRGQVVAWLQLFHCISRALCEDNICLILSSLSVSLLLPQSASASASPDYWSTERPWIPLSAPGNMVWATQWGAGSSAGQGEKDKERDFQT